MSSQGTGTGLEVVGAAVDQAGRKPKSKQKNKGGAAGGDSHDPGLVSLVLSLEARLRAVEAATYSVVLVQRETSLPFKNMRDAGKKYAQLVEAKGRREHDLGSPHLHVFLALLVHTGHVRASARSRPTSSGQGRGRQNAAGAGHRAPDTGRTGRVGHDVPRRGLLRQASAGTTGRDNGSVVAPVRPDAVPTSRGNHDEADERTERARLALVRARREAQGGGGPTRRESTSTRQVAPTRPSTTEPSILLFLEGRTPSVPSRRGTPRRLMRSQGITPTPQHNAPGVRSSIFRLDWLHVADLGVSADWLGGLFTFLAEHKFPGRSFAAKLSGLWQRIQQLYRVHLPAARLDQLTDKMLNRGSPSPKLRCYGMEVCCLIPVAKDLAQEYLREGDLVEQATRQGTLELSACYDCLS